MSNENHTDDRIDSLEDRVASLEDNYTVTDDDGEEWTLDKLMDIGLTRRQALGTLGALALYGGSIWGAFQYATRDAEAASTDQVGTIQNPVSLVADDVSITNLGASVYLGSNQSITDNTSTKVQFDTINADDESEWSTSNYQFTAADTGVYHVSAQLRWADSLGDQNRVDALIKLNGNTVADRRFYTSGNTSPAVAVSKTLYDVSAGDTIQIEAYQNSGGAAALNSGGTNTYVTITQVG